MVKIANVGAGYWGKNLVRNFAELGALAAIVDPNPQVADDLSAKYNVPVCTLDEVLANEEIDGVAYATPAETHADFAIKALEAGKHVYVEKPLALSIDDAERMIAKGKEVNRAVMVGHLLQYHPVFQTLLEMVRNGKVGNVKHIYSNRMSLGKFRLEENVWWSFAPHDISMVLAVIDEEPNAISAQGGSYVTPGIADWVTVQLQFASGANAHFNISWMHPFKEQRLSVIGDKGMLVFEDSNPKWEQKLAFYAHEITKSENAAPLPKKADVEYIAVENGEPLRNECQHFIDCITQGLTPRTDGEEGHRVLRVLQDAEMLLRDKISV